MRQTFVQCFHYYKNGCPDMVETLVNAEFEKELTSEDAKTQKAAWFRFLEVAVDYQEHPETREEMERIQREEKNRLLHEKTLEQMKQAKAARDARRTEKMRQTFVQCFHYYKNGCPDMVETLVDAE